MSEKKESALNVNIFNPISFGLIFLVILATGITLRRTPSLYLLGGQDQGTYVSMAQQYSHEGKLYITDEYRESLTKEQQELYDKNGNYIMPSFEKWNRPDSEYSMVFYPAHPALLSTFGSVFGMNNSVYLLTVLSLITLINIYLIAYHLTNSKKTAAITMLLFALNPVHVFMSKFPVSETTALTFITTGYYLLIRYLKSNKEIKNKLHYLLFSLMAFGVFSLTRMTFFIHIPVILLLSVINNKPKKEKIILAVYTFLNFGILAVSYRFYRTFLNPLFNRIYPKTIIKALNNFIPLNISNEYKILIILAVVLIIALLSTFKSIQKITKKIFPLIYTAGISYLIWKIILLTQGDWAKVMTSKNSSLRRWNILHRGIDAIKHVPLISIFNYVSIFGILIFAVLIIYNLIKERKYLYFLLTGIAVYFVYVYLYRASAMRYDYYNARYYLTEVVPSLLLTIGIFLGDLLQKGKVRKYISLGVITSISVYFGFFSFFQIGKYEGNDQQLYNQIAQQVTTKDLIVYINKDIYKNKYSSNFNSYVAGPLKYYFNFNLLVLDDFDEIESPIAQSILDKHNTVYYVSNVPLDSSEGSLSEQKLTLHYNYFNNPPGCNYHNYEFLETTNIQEWPLPDFLECKLLPNAYFENQREYYFGILK